MTKGEQARVTAWRWKVLQHAADEQNVARVCRHFGISRKSFYKWTDPVRTATGEDEELKVFTGVLDPTGEKWLTALDDFRNWLIELG